MPFDLRRYRNSNTVVTGGLGFIGSNLAIRLSDLGARVTIIDSSVPGCGANTFNIQPISDRVTVVAADIEAGAPVEAALEKADFVFNLAGELSHVHSMSHPARDLALNTRAHQIFLDSCVKAAPGVRVVYASTRQVYGVPQSLPVDEGHPVAPVDFNGVHKYATEHYHLLQTRLGHIDAVVLRLTNVYGPRLAIGNSCQGFFGVFLRRALLKQPIELFGDGEQLRDPIHVDDAVEAFLRAGLAKAPEHRVMNVGSGIPVSLKEIAEVLGELGGGVKPRYKPFPAERRRIDIGSYYSCTERITSAFGWHPRIALREGLDRTLSYFAAHREQYHSANATCPVCPVRPTAPS